MVGLAGVGASDRLDGAQRSEYASGHYGTGGRVAACVATDGPDRRADRRLLYRTRTPPVASYVECRRLGWPAAAGMDRRAGNIAETHPRTRTVAGDDARAAGFCRACSRCAEGPVSRSGYYDHEFVGRVRGQIPQFIPQPDGPAVRRDSARISRRADPFVRHRPHLRGRSAQRGAAAALGCRIPRFGGRAYLQFARRGRSRSRVVADDLAFLLRQGVDRRLA